MRTEFYNQIQEIIVLNTSEEKIVQAVSDLELNDISSREKADQVYNYVICNTLQEIDRFIQSYPSDCESRISSRVFTIDIASAVDLKLQEMYQVQVIPSFEELSLELNEENYNSCTIL